MMYPLKFTPILKKRLWGGNAFADVYHKTDNNQIKYGESWEISDLDDNVSVVSNGFLAENDLRDLIETYMGDLVGDAVYEKCGLGFPLLIKLIDAQDNLSVQVHPNDELAQRRYAQNGKTEIWYVVHAEKNAGVYVGFNKPVVKNEYIEAIRDNTVVELLQFIPAKKDDLFFIPAGTIHALGKGVRLVEIQQPSDITYRIFDWDRVGDDGIPRELHIEETIDAINFEDNRNCKIEYDAKLNTITSIFRSEFFNINVLLFDKPLQKSYASIDSFVVYHCIEGEAHLFCDEVSEVIKAGETLLKPANIQNVNFVSKGGAKLLEVFL